MAATLDPATVVLACDGGELLGAMVLTDAEHLSTSDDWAVAREIYGTVGAARRLALLAPLDTKPPVGCLYVDWVAVAPQSRGRGVGSNLLAFADEVAKQRGLSTVALDVVDSNPRAQALYSRLGFDVESTRSVWPFRWLYQIRSYTRMLKTIAS
ncbi:MAG: GNAT family N-acetyltransferase [Actinobacteria bacterium]|nr:GNAT family N-acetyltransferase [Actinomycetota bacterium]